ncbi:hypothetical protein [Myxococcus eversor]|uniref:hypothetical protein n=1 Tax=Myxococcus eversor TaxID=2709661 RepID=UPI0013D251F9|nr:hypothetical protein [Myxococcus eversor]
MNQTSVPSSRVPSSYLALLHSLALLSLTGCGPDNAPFGVLGTIDGEYGGEWRHFSDNQGGSAVSPVRDARPNASRIQVCGADDDGSRKNMYDDTGLCFLIDVDTALLGTGPTTLVIDGLAKAPEGWAAHETAFAPRQGHSPAVQSAFASSFCYEGPYQSGDMHLEVTGTMDLWVNDATRVAGHLVLETVGETNGRCPTRKARANVEFDLEPRPARTGLPVIE